MASEEIFQSKAQKTNQREQKKKKTLPVLWRGAYYVPTARGSSKALHTALGRRRRPKG